MADLIKLYVDFQNTDSRGRVRLICKGTLDDLIEKGIQLTSGLKFHLHDGEELNAIGIVERSNKENIWVAQINWIDLN